MFFLINWLPTAAMDALSPSTITLTAGQNLTVHLFELDGVFVNESFIDLDFHSSRTWFFFRLLGLKMEFKKLAILPRGETGSFAFLESAYFLTALNFGKTEDSASDDEKMVESVDELPEIDDDDDEVAVALV